MTLLLWYVTRPVVSTFCQGNVVPFTAWHSSVRRYFNEKTDHHWLRQWLVAWPAPSHYLNQWWSSVNWNLMNKLQWNINRNSYIFNQENAFEYVVWKMAAILSRPKCVDTCNVICVLQIMAIFSIESARWLLIAWRPLASGHLQPSRGPRLVGICHDSPNNDDQKTVSWGRITIMTVGLVINPRHPTGAEGYYRHSWNLISLCKT